MYIFKLKPQATDFFFFENKSINMNFLYVRIFRLSSTSLEKGKVVNKKSEKR